MRPWIPFTHDIWGISDRMFYDYFSSLPPLDPFFLEKPQNSLASLGLPQLFRRCRKSLQVHAVVLQLFTMERSEMKLLNCADSRYVALLSYRLPVIQDQIFRGI
ncbi:uncharacterized protein [Elaeis guineensis]|uniref:Uncharacterized protein LOC105043393 n=1 Tax=Elaeis guineensis var. tenera TaxID=51953 RepID=A0A8N4EYC8_ELAGV|nr:uncharacterized protein LOC105043393 [Elaeis guineensis]